MNTDEKFKPTIFVGLGGNGGKIVNILAGKLRRHPAWDHISSMTHFVAIDTNKDDLDKASNIPPDCRYVVSAFDRPAYVARKRGERELPEDPRVTQWIHPWYRFRAAQGAGAGQIRLESRLGLYYNLEEDRAQIRQKFERILDQCTRRENPWRDEKVKVVQIMLYASVAGGTGSGGFLPMAYLLRDIVDGKGWGRPEIVCVLTLPTTFLDKVKPELHADIKANGYAALKELEYLTRELGYQGGANEIEFHYDPGSSDRDRQFVRRHPFDIVYLIDRPSEISIDRYEHAVADASFLQVYSPLLGMQKGELDNYDKHGQTLALGNFSKNYGAFGVALLRLPRNDLVRYASMRYLTRALRDFLCFGGDDARFRVPYGDPVFERKDVREKEKIADEKFEAYVVYRSSQEQKDEEKGFFFVVEEQQGKSGKTLAESFRLKIESVYGRLDELISISDIEKQSINPGNPSLTRPITILREESAASRGAVRTYLEAQLADLHAGRLFSSFFTEEGVNPVAQRLFLIRLFRSAFITPFADSEDGAFLRSDASKIDLDSSTTQEELRRLEADLVKMANPSLTEKLLDRDNKKFQTAKLRATRKHDELVQAYREDLRRYFWRAFEDEMRKMGAALMGQFRKVSEIASEAATTAEKEAKRFLEDPGSFADSDVAEYYLDLEVLRDDRGGKRLWDVYYGHYLDRSTYFDVTSIFRQITDAFLPARDRDGRPREREPGEIIQFVRDRLLTQAKTTYAKAIEDLCLDVGRALELEERYILLAEAGANVAALRESGTFGDAVDKIDADTVQRRIEDKLLRMKSECALLANLDASKEDDPTVTVANIAILGMAKKFDSDEPSSLGRMFKRVYENIGNVDGWLDVDSIVLYRAKLAIPIYFFGNVQAQLYPAYRQVRDQPSRSYPLHIEAAWEPKKDADGKLRGLPDLDPMEIRRIRELERAEREALARKQSRADRVRAFTMCLLFGSVLMEDGNYVWSLRGVKNTLGKDRLAAFQAFEGLDPLLRKDIESPALKTWDERKVERSTRQKLRAELARHSERVQDAYLLAVTEERDEEKRFVSEEREIVESMDRELAS